MPGFSNQLLRDQRTPAGLDHATGLPAHRLRDMLNEAGLDKLLAWSREPGLLPRIPSGPEPGRPWARLGLETLQAFAKGRDADVRFTVEAELRRRGGFCLLWRRRPSLTSSE